MSLRFVTNDELFIEAIEPIYKARSFVWIGTADIKDLHVQYRSRVVSFLSVLNDLCKRKVAVRLPSRKGTRTQFQKELSINIRLFWIAWNGSCAPGCILNISSLTES